jgi:hypothetical protein
MSRPDSHVTNPDMPRTADALVGNPEASTVEAGQADMSTSTDAGAAIACGAATPFLGDAAYAGSATPDPVAGTGVLADPPFDWHGIAFSGNDVLSYDQQELWFADLSATSPVEKRFAGTAGNNDFHDGPCGTTARFANAQGVVVLPSGDLLVADLFGNAFLKVTSPLTTSCAVSYFAGNNQPQTNMSAVFSPGDTDGTGSAAKLSGPTFPVGDGAGNAFFYDAGNNKLKRVDTAGAVTTVATLPTSCGPYTALTYLNGKLYVTNNNGATGSVLEVDATSGAMRTVLSGRADVWGLPCTSSSMDLSSITTNGTGLYVQGNGYVWYLTLGGTLTLVAGNGEVSCFPPAGYDPKASHAALCSSTVTDCVQLQFNPGDALTMGQETFLAWQSGTLYAGARATANYVEQMTCP